MTFFKRIKTTNQNFTLGKKSLKKLQGVHPDLIAVVHRAIQITTVDFTVLEGVRTLDRQKTLLKQGKSQTLNSRHIPRVPVKNKELGAVSHAVDLGAFVNGKILWNWHYYEEIAIAMKKAAKELNINIEWGGDWKSFKDGVHFELSRFSYYVF
jgi:peptidoglycan L-alanyl-D-glutamate endopeptidase CwlK